MIDDNISPFLSKQGQTVIELARLLLTRQPGQELERIHDYAARFGVGAGTVQAALRYIQEAGAVDLQMKGHLGTFIGRIDYPLLWSITGQEYMVGTMPLPYSRRYEGLATGLHQAFKQARVRLNMMFSRGSTNRLLTLAGGMCDFVVLSRFAFDVALRDGMEIVEVVALGPETYVGQHVVLLRDPAREQIEDGMRVGVDPQSIDQAELTRQACQGKDVEFVETSYMHLAAALQRGELDAAVWNRDDFSLAERGTFQATPSWHFKTVPLSLLEASPGMIGNTEAVVVANRNHAHLKNPLRAIIDTALVCHIQRQVMEGQVLPAY